MRHRDFQRVHGLHNFGTEQIPTNSKVHISRHKAAARFPHILQPHAYIGHQSLGPKDQC